MNTSIIKVLGREPAAWLALVAALVKAFSAFVMDVDPSTQAVVNAVAGAAMGLVIALIVHDGAVAAVLGLIQAVIALTVGLGLDWSTDKQAVFMTVVTLALAGYDRTQVTAPVPARVRPLSRV
ncbi:MULTISPECIES: hypothetical protein [unclassified Streptomyces]|uniref:hypothetical protein n=1 Tax=unclassified Streptomyces TaxID=2593676 RepID=UPI003407096B